MAANKKMISEEGSEVKDDAGKNASEDVEKQPVKAMEKSHHHSWTYSRVKADVPKGFDPFPSG